MARGPSGSSHEENVEVLTLAPIGAGGVDIFTHPAALGPEFLQRAENIRTGDGTLSRRDGAVKIYRPTDVCGSKTFGTTGKYATFTPDLIPKGGFALRVSFVATRPSGGNTAWILSSRPSGQAFHVLKVTLSDAGVVTCAWHDSAGGDQSIAATAVSDGTTVHLLSVFDAYAGTFTLYINGASSGTPVTGLASTLTTDQSSGVVWAVGVEKQTGSAVTANSQFTGAVDSLTLFSLAGMQPAAGATTFVSTLLKHSARQWPAPQMDAVMFNYDMDAASAMYDSSRGKNHATLTGSPSDTSAVAMSSIPTNYVGSFDTPLGSRFNVAGIYGRLVYQAVRGDA